MGTKRSPRSKQTGPVVGRRKKVVKAAPKLDPVEFLMSLPPADPNDPTRLKARTEFMEAFVAPGTMAYNLGNPDEILKALEWGLRERAQVELDLEDAKKALRQEGNRTKRRPITPEIWHEHLEKYPIEARHPERSGQWRADRIVSDYPDFTISNDAVNARLRKMKPTK